MSVPDVAEAHAALAKGFCCFGSELGEFLLRPLEDLRPTIMAKGGAELPPRFYAPLSTTAATACSGNWPSTSILQPPCSCG